MSLDTSSACQTTRGVRRLTQTPVLEDLQDNHHITLFMFPSSTELKLSLKDNFVLRLSVSSSVSLLLSSLPASHDSIVVIQKHASRCPFFYSCLLLENISVSSPSLDFSSTSPPLSFPSLSLFSSPLPPSSPSSLSPFPSSACVPLLPPPHLSHQ